MRALNEIKLPDMSGGLNTHDPEYEIADNQSPDMLNLWFKNKALCKRPGQSMVISGLPEVHRISDEYCGFRIVHAANKFFRWEEGGARSYKGTFDAREGYPAPPEYPQPLPGDYYVVAAGGEGVIEGEVYHEGDRAVYYPSLAQTEKTTVQGTVTASGYARVIVTAARLTGSPVVIEVEVALGDNAEAAAGKIRASMAANAAVTSLYTVGGASAEVSLTQITPHAYDDTLNISIENGTCAGITDFAMSQGTVMWHNALREIDSADELSAVQDKAGAFITFGDKAYYIDGAEIWHIDAAALKYTAVEPYVPVVMINCRHDLTESADSEPYNLLGGGFCVKYNGNSEAGARYTVTDVTEDTFKLCDYHANMSPVDITSNGASGWRVRKQGLDWIEDTWSANSDSDSIILEDHGLSEGDIVEFDPGTGTLPGGITRYDAAVYKLPQSGLDPKEPLVLVGAQQKISGTHYTFDNIAGTVTFLPGCIPETGTNNVWITAYKVIQGNKDKITGCTAAVAFGGEAGGLTGGTRVFVTANPAYPLSHWHSDLGLHVGSGIRYFPDTGEEYIDQNGESITAAAKMGGELVIFKKNSVFALRYAFDGQDAYFPVRECNNAVGCDMPGSVQLIDNRLVFANTTSGVHMLISTGNEREDVIKPLSANINGLLLCEQGLEGACSCDYERYYWLCVNGRAYLWDYEQTPYYNYSDYEQAQKRLAWYRFDGINAHTFSAGQTLYYGAEGGIAGLTGAKDDFGKPYEAYFLSKAFDLGRPEELKTFMFAYPSFSPDANIKACVTVGSEDRDELVTRQFDIKSFSWDGFNWGAFTWNTIKYAKTYSMRLGIKKVSYVQVKVSGNETGRGVGLSGLRLTYFANRKVKR